MFCVYMSCYLNGYRVSFCFVNNLPAKLRFIIYKFIDDKPFLIRYSNFKNPVLFCPRSDSGAPNISPRFLIMLSGVSKFIRIDTASFT